MTINEVIHYLLELQATTGKMFIFTQDLREAIDNELKEAEKNPVYYKYRENLLEIRQAI